MRWVRRIALVLLLSVGGLVLSGAYLGYRLSHPSAEDFHPQVQITGRALREALERVPAQRYLLGFHYQDTWSTCGPASLRNALLSLGADVDSERALFGEDRLAWWRALGLGMTLDELAALARANTPHAVEVLRPANLDAFRAILDDANEPDTRLIVNFDRAPVFGVSVGHFSPIGGYEAATGWVTLLDVTEGYGFSLVPDTLLLQATRMADPVSGRARGVLRIVAPQASADRPMPRGFWAQLRFR